VNPQVWNLLGNCRALATLSSTALQDLHSVAAERSFEPGDALMTQGDPAEGLLILLEGAARALLRGQDGEDRCIGRFTSGDVVGEMALVTREPRSATVIADSPIRALLVPTAAFDRLAVRHLELGMVLTQLVADRLGRDAHDGFGGKKVEGFRILRGIGRGGMSVVYRAQEESTGDLVALKMMSYRLIYDPDALARFHQEAEILQALDHENIAHLKRLFAAFNTYFLVMELCEGVDLQRLVRSRGRLAEAQVRPILGQLARALEYVHQRGLVHRDLKPGNVMITRHGDVKLTDFGLVVPVFDPADQATTGVHTVMGTPAFMAPEQLSGGPLDRRTDVYALGCLAYDLLTGHRLFRATSVFELARQKLTLQLPAAADIGEGISADLYAFLQGALRVRPDERPASAASLLPWAARCDPLPQDLIDEVEA
jgi:eukaryotic-like serine/threonine-protein kinase